MFKLFKRKRSGLKPKDFMVEMKAALTDDGFNPAWLDEILPHPEHMKVDRLSAMLQKRGLEPSEAAKAIEIGTHLYNEKRTDAEKKGWPLQYTDGVPPEYSDRECFYLEQMVDAAATVKKQRKKKR